MGNCALALLVRMKRSMARAITVVGLVIGVTVGTASATTITFESALLPEVGGSSGFGTVSLVYDDIAHTLAIDAVFSGLTGTTTLAHIHCCTAVPFAGTVGVAVTPGTLPGFPVGATSGSYNTLLDLTQTATYTAAFVTASGGTVAGAEARLLAGLYAGTAYFNVHSSFAGGGEIRGFPQPVPERSSTLLLLGSALAATALYRRRLGA
jgi:hypothetical protein